MLLERQCEECGRPILGGETKCSECAARDRKPGLSPESVLVLCFPALLLFLAITGFVVRQYDDRQKILGEEWSARGQAALREHRPAEAIEDFRTALAYARDNPDYQLRLSLALVAGNRPDEARSYLLSLWASEPESGPINLELGRLSGARNDVLGAVRYYHSAIYGRWDDDPATQRRNARLELYQFLQSHGAKAESQAELMAFAADLPADPSLHIEAGNLFLSANDYDRALNEFQQALRLGGNQAALAGAGKAAFLRADYVEAQRYLERAARTAPRSAEAIHLLETTNLLLEINPFDPRLTAEQRNQRVVRAFEQARTRLESCAQERHEVLDAEEPQTALQALYVRTRKLQPQARERTLRRDPDAVAAILNLALEIEQITARSCGPPSGLDRALLLIAEKHGGTQS